MSSESNSAKGFLQLENVSKVFPQRDDEGVVTAVDDVSLDIPAGEFVTLLGPSGCGKTTTLRMIAGFELPSQGRILLDGQDITNRPPNKRDMALVFQSYALFPHMTVAKNVAYGLEIRGLKRAEIQKTVQHVLELVGLQGLGERRPNELSGGQQQRVALARSLVMEPRVLLLDEPLSNLDAKLRVQMRSEIRDLQRRLNITSVYVTHDQVEAMALSDRIVVMNAGVIEQIGTPEEIYRFPETHFVADFIGYANFIHADLLEQNENNATIQIFGKTVEVETRHLALRKKNDESASPNGKVEAVLRPEAMTLSEDGAGQSVRVTSMMYLGSHVEYLVNYEGQQLLVIDNDPRFHRIFEVGEYANLDFVPETVHLLPLTDSV